LVVNIYIKTVKDWDSSFPLFTGMFSDLDPNWYQNVGVTILFSMILNIITPHLVPLVTFLIKSCKRSCDRSGNKGGKKTKKNTRQEYLALYIGPEFDIGTRYSMILTTLFVTLVYSSGMPLLYVCCFFYFFMIYWIDKLMILRFYKKPPHTDIYIANLFNIIILFGMVIHYGFGIWTYGNKNILTDNSSNSLAVVSSWIKNLFQVQKSSFGAEVLDRITQPHNVICLVFMIVIFLIFLWRIFFMDFFMKYLCHCLDKNSEKLKDLNIYEGKIEFNFF
jgi:hypothetical protein